MPPSDDRPRPIPQRRTSRPVRPRAATPRPDEETTGLGRRATPTPQKPAQQRPAQQQPSPQARQQQARQQQDARPRPPVDEANRTRTMRPVRPAAATSTDRPERPAPPAERRGRPATEGRRPDGRPAPQRVRTRAGAAAGGAPAARAATAADDRERTRGDIQASTTRPRAPQRPDPARPRPAALSRAEAPARRDDDGVPPTRRPRARRPLRTAGIVLLCLALLWGGGMWWAAASAWDTIRKVDATPHGERVAEGRGRNVLMVGSDSRKGLSRAQRNTYGTGGDVGARTDTIMVLHMGDGKPTLMSIPRDSYVNIPGHGMNKINAAYSIGGADLLAKTVEQSTGLRIDGYLEIGFGGFAKIVDEVGGVHICVKRDMNDPKAHINLKKGCQTLKGKDALGYVRARYSDPEGDLGRATRQRQFLGALMGKLATPTNMLLPWQAKSVGDATAKTVTIGKDDSMWGTGQTFLALRRVAKGDGYSVTVPTSDSDLPTPVGSAVQWDEAGSKQLFDDLRNDRPLSVQPEG